MSYSLTLSNGNYVPGIGSAGLQDGTVDTESTSLSLVGKNYPGYGKLLNENLVHLLENFANTTSPASALPGQLWWNSSTKVLNVNTAASVGNTAIWKALPSIFNANPITDASAGTVGTPKDIPYAPNLGDFWWDTANKQLKLYSAIPAEGANGWITIGPVNSATTGQSGAAPDTILDNNNISHVVIKFYISNVLSAILSKDPAFIPGTPITGFPTIYPGLNLSHDSANTPLEFYGNANVALNLMVGGTIVSANNFVRSDVVTQSNVSFTTTSNDGLTIGSNGDFVANISPVTGNAGLYMNTNNKDIVMYVKYSGGTVPVLRANGSSGLAEVYNSPVSPNGIANKSYVDNMALLRDGSSTITGTLIPSANAAINLGSTTSWFANIYGVSMQAKYADLAERFAADAEYEAGTVVELAGPAEITAVSADLSENVFGVISTNAAYLMNAGSGNDITHPPVALSGRVPVKVTGKVKKGDRLVSAGNGMARSASRSEITPWNVIGRALQDKETDGFGLVEAIVKINN